MTPKDKNMRFRITEDEFRILQEEATKAGFSTLSDYIRHMTIGPGRLKIDEKLDALNKDVKEILSKFQPRNKNRRLHLVS